jgi:hypothetical protein
MQSDDFSAYLNIETGEVITAQTEFLGYVEDGKTADDFDNEERQEFLVALDIIDNPEKYYELPSSYDLNEYQIMKDFASEVTDEHVSELLFLALDGVGAFRRFKDVVYRYDLSDEWYRFRDQAYKEILIEWCDEHELDYIDDFQSIEN